MREELDKIICALKQCYGDINEGWRKSDGFWGKVALKCGHSNTDYMRRALYMMWHKDTDNIKEKFTKHVPSKSEETLNEVLFVLIQHLKLLHIAFYE